ncbi:hypothetical protein [Bdellovibrio reynosensis]|uniref:Uncharacterized protein n=1 Tax=Bdellovibrio reynosensis TaxID=2835041 RepID=A0ABY4C9F7_9BACT|nr:hypothetical protein [Bdellovibrio reynosensis]UOF01580.1 hypothetical protein MNR06_01260 [Bdellovibrio reynosensis]
MKIASIIMSLVFVGAVAQAADTHGGHGTATPATTTANPEAAHGETQAHTEMKAEKKATKKKTAKKEEKKEEAAPAAAPAGH